MLPPRWVADPSASGKVFKPGAEQRAWRNQQRVFDLLDSATPAVNLREDVAGRVYVDGALEQDIPDPVAAAKVRRENAVA